MILGWFTTQTFQERFEKLSQKSQPGDAKISHLLGNRRPGHSVLFVYLNTVSISYPTFGVNQLHLSSAFLCYDRFISAWPAVTRVFRPLRLLGSLYEASFGAMSACACSNLCAPRTINPAHCLPCAILVWGTSPFASCLLYSGVCLLLLVLLVSEILDYPRIIHRLFIVPDSLPVWFNSKWSAPTLCNDRPCLLSLSLVPRVRGYLSLCCFGIQRKEWTQVGEHFDYDLTPVIVNLWLLNLCRIKWTVQWLTATGWSLKSVHQMRGHKTKSIWQSLIRCSYLSHPCINISHSQTMAH